MFILDFIFMYMSLNSYANDSFKVKVTMHGRYYIGFESNDNINLTPLNVIRIY